MSDTGEKIAAGVGAIIGLAVLAIAISQRANTANVLGAFFGGLSNLIGVAISPVTGQSVSGLSAGLTGGAWQNGTSSVLGAAYGVNVGGAGQISNVAGNLAGGVVNGLLSGGAYGYGAGGGVGGGLTNVAGMAGGFIGGGGGADALSVAGALV